MSSQLTPRIALLSALYFIIAVALIFLLDLGLDWILNNAIFSILNWFNRLSLVFKILLILIGGLSLFANLLAITGKISTLFGGLIFNKLPQNWFTFIAPMLLSTANAIWYIIVLWKIPEHYNFWIVCELILLSIFIWGLSAIVLPAKTQLEAQ